MIRLRVGLAVAVGTLAGCGGAKETPAPAAPSAAWTDNSPHRASFVTANGVRLNVLDWGGTGPALVLIHGLGDSPHVYDDLAPLLTKDFHVVAYARRGHASSEKTGPYDNGTLTEDLKQLLDSLKIQRAALLGWSMGGNEISEFAVRYPGRVSGLVYVDAGYDWADSMLIKAFNALPVSISPGAGFPSLDSLRDWYQITWLVGLKWPAAWEAHMRDLVDLAPDGSVKFRQTDSVNGLMFASLTGYPKNFKAIKAPALSLWAPLFLPRPVSDTAALRKVDAWEKAFFGPFRAKSIRRFKTEVAGAIDTILPNTSHASIATVDVDGVARLVRSFLLEKAK